MEIKLDRNKIFLLILAVLVIISVIPWFKEGVAATDDFRHHITKFWWIEYSFDNYGKYVDWMPFIYSGWPMTHFYHSLPYFISIPFIFVLEPIASLKASIVASFILAAIAMFFATKKLFKNNQVAAVSTIFYMLAPLHFEFAYLSGSISRLWAYIFLPLSIVYFISLVEEGGKKNIIIAGLSIAALAYTNLNILIAASYIFLFYLIYYFFIKEKRILVKKIKDILICVLFVIGLLSVWLIPFMLEKQDSYSASELGSNILGNAPAPVKIDKLFVRDFGRADNGRFIYVGYSFLIISLLGLYTLKFEKKIIFGALGIIGLILTVFTEPIKFFPLGGGILINTYFLLIAIIFFSMISGLFVYEVSKMKNGLIYALLIILIFAIDVWPAQTTNYWSNQPTEHYTNSPEIIDAYDFIKEQPGLFRTYSLVGELPFVYTEKSEIGTMWTGFREGAFRPIRELTDDIESRIKSNLTDINVYYTLGYMGNKFILLPCINGFDKFIPLAYDNKAVCVYENPAFTLLVDSPRKIIISETASGSADAFILEKCAFNCEIDKKPVQISEVTYGPEVIEFKTDSSESGFVIVKESYFEQHWHAYVNGKEEGIRKAWPYYMLIEVPPGDNEVTFKYKTNSNHIIGWIITILTVLLTVYFARKK